MLLHLELQDLNARLLVTNMSSQDVGTGRGCCCTFNSRISVPVSLLQTQVHRMLAQVGVVAAPLTAGSQYLSPRMLAQVGVVVAPGSAGFDACLLVTNTTAHSVGTGRGCCTRNSRISVPVCWSRTPLHTMLAQVRVVAAPGTAGSQCL